MTDYNTVREFLQDVWLDASAGETETLLDLKRTADWEVCALACTDEDEGVFVDLVLGYRQAKRHGQNG